MVSECVRVCVCVNPLYMGDSTCFQQLLVFVLRGGQMLRALDLPIGIACHRNFHDCSLQKGA